MDLIKAFVSTSLCRRERSSFVAIQAVFLNISLLQPVAGQ